jgi:hypothetical protein
LSLLVALWGFAAAAIARRGYGPLLIGLAAAFALVIGKFFLYSNTLWIGEFALLIFASFWNAWRRDSKRAYAGGFVFTCASGIWQSLRRPTLPKAMIAYSS